jgi:hypothetical protein
MRDVFAWELVELAKNYDHTALLAFKHLQLYPINIINEHGAINFGNGGLRLLVAAI